MKKLYTLNIKKIGKVSLSRKDLEEFASNDIGFYGLDLHRISTILIAQVLQMQANRVINTHQMLDEVKYLEGLRSNTSTGDAEPFKHKPLKGLKKKHFTGASFILKNLNAQFGYEWGGNRNLDKLVAEAFERNKSGYVDDEFIPFVVYNSGIGVLEERAKKRKITGEWIVFEEYEGKNYYLTLAAHNEGDDNIYKRVCDAYDFDFPFLREHA